MMLALSQSFVARSSLEEMLDSLQRRDQTEEEDKPPALPPRPKSNPRSRPPSTKRHLATNLTDIPQMPFNPEVRGQENHKSSEQQLLNGVSSQKGINHEASASPVRSHRRPGESGGDFGLRNLSNKRLRVWYRSSDDLWQQGQIKSRVGEKALVLMSDERVIASSTKDLQPANPDILDAVGDLEQLIYLNEPSIVHALQCRYSQDMIYTKAGRILIALNPLKDIDIYGKEFLNAYRDKLLCQPHVYALVNEAYDKIMSGGGNQSIIISGESGAGKTETAKRASEYLATIAGGIGGLASKVLQIRYILEAFGNAKTSRNDNSSRFGNLFEFHFSNVGEICRVQIKTFLVEKSRVVHLAPGERSFHIFYQLCSGVSADLRGQLRLRSASEYSYLNQSNCVEISNIDDFHKFHILTGALNAVGICKEDQHRVFELLSAVLWLGNISFLATDDQAHVEVVHSEALNHSSSLMGCSRDELVLALSTRKIKVGKEAINRRLTLQQAIERRDALAKLIYTTLFDWLVEKINLYLGLDKCNAWGSISILEMCGFEISEDNGFEQFCINYADERLQKHFFHQIFKRDQEEYKSEGIHWMNFDFRGNNDCLDLFEKKPTGLISILDEASSLPLSTDINLVAKLSQQLSANQCFKGQKDGTFTICHSAGEVIYNTSEFLLKNRDASYPEMIHLLSSRSSEISQYFSLVRSDRSSLQSETQNMQNQSFTSKLQDQLLKLFQHLDNTKPQFISCVRPNNKQIASLFEQSLVLQQLQRCGILDAVRISKYGYPTRISIEDFSRRYAVLAPNTFQRDSLSTSVGILQHSGIPPEMHHVGYTKIFFRAGQIELLENARHRAQQGMHDVQICHRWRSGGDIFKFKEAATVLQSYVRGEIARKEFRKLLHFRTKDGDFKMHDGQLMAVVSIQSVIRAWLVKRRHTRPPNRTQFKDLLRQPLSAEELQGQVSMLEAELEEKEKENTDLRNRVKQLEARWPQYEAKVKSLEEKWQKKADSQVVPNSKKTIVLEAQPRRFNGVQSPRSSYSDDTCTGSITPGCGTPARNVESSVDDAHSRDDNGVSNPINSLVKEFEQRRQLFDVEARAIVGVKSSGRHSPSSVNPVEEVELLKCKFKMWKREFGIRLREAKAKASRMGRPEGEKHRWKWWGIKRRRS